MPLPAVVPAAVATVKVVVNVAAQQTMARATSGALRHIHGCAVGLLCATLAFVVLCPALAAPMQLSTLAWPVAVPAAGAEGNGWTAGGWRISSPFGWRPSVADPGRLEFHEGVDIAGPTFCLHCPVVSIADARVAYIGWDPQRDRSTPPTTSGGGMVVELDNGPAAPAETYVPPEMRMTYAHLAPYRLYVQLQGRIDDPWDQEAFRAYGDYGEIGTGELLPGIDDGALDVTCTGERASRLPLFVPERTGSGTVVFAYDKPIVAPDSCTVSVAWPPRGDGWGGWIADDPASTETDGVQRASLAFTTPIQEGLAAGNVALRFRAHLQAPPPPPTPTPDPLATPQPSSATDGMPEVSNDHAGGDADTIRPRAVPHARTSNDADLRGSACRRDGSTLRCRWKVADLPQQASAAARAAATPASMFTAGSAHTQAALAGTPHQHIATANTKAGLPPVAPVSATPVLLGMPERAGVGAGQASNSSAASMAERVAARDWCANAHLTRVAARDDFPCLVPETADAWQRARERITAALGFDWLATYPSDLMRDPTFVPQQDNQILYSWHKTGRAVDVPQHGPGLRHVAEGAYERLFVSGVDITAIMESSGFRRIPSNPSRPEWWHYELQGGLTWACAMRQIYAVNELERWFPELKREWQSPDCKASDPGDGAPVPPTCPELPGGEGLQAAMEFIAGQGARLTGRFNDIRVINGVPTRHGGIDIAAPAGRPIHAYSGGAVVANAFSAVGGNSLIIRSADGRRSYYGHMQARSPLAIGTSVARGDVLGAIGQSGMATGPHVHFQLSDASGTWIDPETVLAGGNVPGLPCVPPGAAPSEQPVCIEGQPAYDAAVSEVPGCGPPLRWSTRVRMLDHVVGHIDLTGATTGAHLHLGLRIRNGLSGSQWSQTDICAMPWTPPPLQSIPPGERQRYVYRHWRAQCWTDAADPLDFLPRAHASAPLPQATAAPLDGEPMQLPPPGTDGALLVPVPSGQPAAGEYWSPFTDAGRFGGGGVLEWLRGVVCTFLNWIGLPCSAAP